MSRRTPNPSDPRGPRSARESLVRVLVSVPIVSCSNAIEIHALQSEASSGVLLERSAQVKAVAFSVPYRVELDHPRDLAALVFRTPLAELGLAEGPIGLVEGGALPTADWTFVSSEGGDFALGPVPLSLQGWGIPTPIDCLNPQVDIVEIPGEQQSMVALGNVLHVSTTSAAFQVSPDLVVQRAADWSGYATRNTAQSWMIDRELGVRSWTPSEGFQEEPSFPVESFRLFLAPGFEADPELWVLTLEGAVYRLKDHTWSMLGPPVPLLAEPSIAAVGPGRVWATGMSRKAIREVSENGERDVTFVDTISDAIHGVPSVIRSIRGSGLFVFTSEHHVYVNRADGWEHFDLPVGDVRGAFELGGSPWVVAQQGRILALYQITDRCTPISIDVGPHASAVERVGPDAFVLSEDTERVDAALVRIRIP